MDRKLSFGYLYDFRNPSMWEKSWHDVYEGVLEVASWSETVGFTGAWVPEHHNSADGYQPAPNVALAAIAARTEKLRLGSAISLAPLYDPVRFAEECAVLDIISDGRIEMALAIGYRRSEYEAFGLDFAKRGRRFDEFLDVVGKLWAGETVDHQGANFTVRGARIMPPAPRGRIPLYIGGFADKALDRVAKYADGYFGNEEFCDMYTNKLRDHGKDPADASIRIQGLFFAVAEDPEKAMEELAPYYHYINNSYSVWLSEDNAIGIDNPMLRQLDLDEFKKSGILQIMTPDDAVAKFKDLQQRTNAEHYMMMMPAGLPADRFQEYAQLFADKVIPAFH